MQVISPRARGALWAGAAAGVILLGVVIRLPLAFVAHDIPGGHADSTLYFRKAYEEYAVGFLEPLPHGGSGWPLLLAGAMRVWGIPAGDAAPGSIAGAIVFSYVFHAMVAAGLVAATLLLARLVTTPRAALLAGLLVAFDPFLLRHTTDVMADGLYAILLVLAIACVVKARDGRAWLAVAGALVAVAHMVRVNGLVMIVMIVVFARLYLARTRPDHAGWKPLATIVVAFVLVASPYLLWRAAHLPSAFDYGTNQRMFADDRWNFSDNFWTHYAITSGGPRESWSDYLATHSLGDAGRRAWESVWFQIRDVAFLGGPEEPAALWPVLAILAVGGSMVGRRDPIVWALPLLFGFTFVTFLWIYPSVRSVRYYMPLLPFAAVMGALALDWAILRLSAPARWLVGGGCFVAVVLSLPAGAMTAFMIAGSSPPLGSVVAVMGLFWLSLGLVGWWPFRGPEHPRPDRRRRSRNPSPPHSSGTRRS